MASVCHLRRVVQRFPNHEEVGRSLAATALSYKRLGRTREAEDLFLRALTVREIALGGSHHFVAATLASLAMLHTERQAWGNATDYWRRAVNVTQQRIRLGLGQVEAELADQSSREIMLARHIFSGFVKSAHRLAGERSDSGEGLVDEVFQSVQWALATESANALAQMSARGLGESIALTVLARERQDLIAEWQSLDRSRTSVAPGSFQARHRTAEASGRSRMLAVEMRLAEIDGRFKSEFPAYASLSQPEPLSIGRARAALRTDEALVLFFDTPAAGPSSPEATFIWVVTKTETRWVRSHLGTQALKREVATLRCGLDTAAWSNEWKSRCKSLLGLDDSAHASASGMLPPFDLRHAHVLYSALFGEVEDLIRDKHLLIVASGALTQLPFHALISAPPVNQDYKAAEWLARRHAITTLPSVTSLQVLRGVAKPSAATSPYMGFGNPLLDGGPQNRPQANLARAIDACGQDIELQLAALRGPGRVSTGSGRPPGRPDIAEIRLLSPLPETTIELCAVARNLRADIDDIRLGTRATEREVKALSASGALARFRILHFATHGALAGQLSGTDEPGLILTPPTEATEQDDGYLSSSEIAGLKLDADLIILSACNTAAGNKEGGEAFAGLARAFFYAGARALLVSHWEVASVTTVKLITAAFAEIAGNTSIGYAEAVRRAMLAIIDNGAPHETHPAYWAPFVVVGEGAAQR